VGWCAEGGIRDVQVLSFQTSIRGTRDEAGALPLVRWDVPDVRHRRVLVFGAGAAGRNALRFLAAIAPGRVVGVVDNDPAKEGTTCEGVTVRRFASVPRDSYDLVVIASLPGLVPIGAQLREAGLMPNQDYLAADQVEQWYGLVVEYERIAA
jgi:hypothetical protein